VKRVVLTSSFASIGYGYTQSERTMENLFTEKDWTRVEGAKSPVGAYEKSKTLAEKAEWEWLEKEGGGMEMASVNPVGIFGPVIGGGSSTSLELPTRLLNGQLPGLPNLSFGFVDVRDVASLHLLAMTKAQAAGQRYLAISDELAVSTKEIAEILKSGLPGPDVKKVPTRMLLSWLLKIVGHFDSTVALIVPELGRVRPTSNAKAKQELGRVPRSASEAIVDSEKSLKQYGFVKT
jgi:dihydroflavonol-4-reductase